MTAADLWIAGAMLWQGAMTLTLLAYLGYVRLPMVARGEVRIRDVALSRENWPEREKKVSNAFDNQFQLPMLFFAGALLGMNLGGALLEAILCWLFVLSRLVHMLIHVTANHVVHRFTAYAIGYFLLCILWLELIVRIVLIALGPH